MKKIGIISDTNGLFDDTLRRFLDPVDEIWHAGDIRSIETADTIAAFRPIKGVYGNIDGGQLRTVFSEFRLWDCEQVRVLMTHIGGYPGKYDKKAYPKIKQTRPGLFITGHFHILRVQFDKINDLLFINPGAAGIYGFHTVRTAIRLEIDGNEMRNLEVGEWPRSGPSKI